MKPNLKHIFICIFVTLSIGCTNNNSFNIQGELNINNQNLTFINNELNNILLRRDDVFIIKNNSISLGYSNIDDNKYFLEGDNNKIKVLNEGKYNIKIIDNKLYFTKIDSSFSNIKLYISDEENYEFIKNDDFTFSLNNVFIDETNFSIISDNYSFNFDINNQDFIKNNNYYKPLKMGYYSFKIDYSLLNPLLITTESLNEKIEIPQNASDYEKIIKSLDNTFYIGGTKLTATQRKVQKEDISGTNYLEEKNINQSYYQETNIINDEIINEAYFYNDKNYFELKEYENSSKKPSLKGYLLGQKKDTPKKDNLIIEEKNYIELNKAQEKVNRMHSFYTTIIQKLNSVIRIQNLNSGTFNEETSTKYYNSLNITKANNISTKIIEIEANNNEIYENGTNSVIVKNYVYFKINNKSQLTEGKIINKKYSGDVLNKTNIDEKLCEYTSTIEFNIEYKQRTKVDSFFFDINKYIINDISFVETTFSCGQTFSVEDIMNTPYSPLTAIDYSNLTIISYDPNYIKKNVISGWIGNRTGTTKVEIGTLYSEKTFEAELYFKYSTLTKLEIKDAVNVNEYYVGGTYEFYVETNSYANPLIKVFLSDENNEFAEIVYIDSDEEMLKTNKPKFKIKMLKETSSLTITAKSKNYPSIKDDLKISILPSVTLDKIAGNYYYNSLNDTYIKLFNDGTGVAKGDVENKTYNFTYQILGSQIYLLDSNDLSKFNASIELYNDKYDLYGLKSITMQDKNNKNIFSYSYGRYNKIQPLMENKYKVNDNISLEFIFEKYSFAFNKIEPTVLILDNDDDYTFTWNPYSVDGEFTSFKKNQTSYYSINIELKNITIDSFDLIISNNDNINLNYHFIKYQ